MAGRPIVRASHFMPAERFMEGGKAHVCGCTSHLYGAGESHLFSQPAFAEFDLRCSSTFVVN